MKPSHTGTKSLILIDVFLKGRHTYYCLGLEDI